MEEQQGTPGPWVMTKSEAEEFFSDEWYIDRAGQDIGAVAIANGEANARRIVLGPEMLEVLEGLSYSEGLCFCPRSLTPVSVRLKQDDHGAGCRRARAIIAKLKGLDTNDPQRLVCPCRQSRPTA